MPIVVQKYGGSSVADLSKIKAVAGKVKAKRDEGFQVVVVVSAMGDTTDELLGLAKQASADPPRRELDMLLSCGERISMALLSMCLLEMDVPAISFTGSQSGIITDDAHAQARIVEVRPFRIQDELAQGKVVIVAGYQGVSYKREVTTLGRGGSDTTAIALAAALSAESCEIYSDVDGVFSADPRRVQGAKKLAELSHEEMQELALAGAKVLNAQAVEFARQKGIAIVARSTFQPGTGTIVRRGGGNDRKVKAVAADPDLAVLRSEGAGPPLTELLDFLDARSLRGQSLIFDRQAQSHSFQIALPLQDLHGLSALRSQLDLRFGGKVRLVEDLGTVTCVGAGINADWANLRRALGAAEAIGIRVHGTQTSPMVISMLVPKESLSALTQRLHDELVGR